MKQLIIICEGETEQAFCREILSPELFQKDIYVYPSLIEKSGGGIVKWISLKKQIEGHLKNNKKPIVTTFIDYYGLKSKLRFPNWEIAKGTFDKNARIDLLERGMKNEITEAANFRFVPFIHMHEFECLLFNNIEVFKHLFDNGQANFNELEKIIDSNPNPEDINDGIDTAPSKLLKKCINKYNKVLHGAILAQAIGIDNIRAKCPRFNNWIEQLESI